MPDAAFCLLVPALRVFVLFCIVVCLLCTGQHLLLIFGLSHTHSTMDPRLDGMFPGSATGCGSGSFDKATWVCDTCGEGMREHAIANPNRELVFELRTHEIGANDVDAIFGDLKSLPNVRMDLSAKYSQAHMHAAPIPEYFNSLPQKLQQTGMKSWLEIRNDDFYFLTWADPEFASFFVNGWGWGDKDQYIYKGRCLEPMVGAGHVIL